MTLKPSDEIGTSEILSVVWEQQSSQERKIFTEWTSAGKEITKFLSLPYTYIGNILNAIRYFGNENPANHWLGLYAFIGAARKRCDEILAESGGNERYWTMIAKSAMDEKPDLFSGTPEELGKRYHADIEHLRVLLIEVSNPQAVTRTKVGDIIS